MHHLCTAGGTSPSSSSWCQAPKRCCGRRQQCARTTPPEAHTRCATTARTRLACAGPREHGPAGARARWAGQRVQRLIPKYPHGFSALPRPPPPRHSRTASCLRLTLSVHPSPQPAAPHATRAACSSGRASGRASGPRARGRAAVEPADACALREHAVEMLMLGHRLCVHSKACEGPSWRGCRVVGEVYHSVRCTAHFFLSSMNLL